MSQGNTPDLKVQSYPLPDPPEDTISSLSWSPDGCLLCATSMNNEVRVWNIARGASSNIFHRTQEFPILTSSWLSPTILLTAGTDNVIRTTNIKQEESLIVGSVCLSFSNTISDLLLSAHVADIKDPFCSRYKFRYFSLVG